MLRRNRPRKITKISLAAVLISAATFSFSQWSCTGHDNPFDPKSKTKGAPFKLNAETGYGQIHLDWEWPTFPAVDGDQIKIDSFLVFRADAVGKLDTFNLELRNSFEDTSILGDEMYQYEVAAYREKQESEHSNPKSSFGYPMPLNCGPFSDDILVRPPNIGFFKKLKFVPSGEELRVFGANNKPLTIGGIYSDTVDLVLAPSASGDSAYIYLCSNLNGRVFVFLWGNNALEPICEMAVERPRVLALGADNSLIYVASDETGEILEFPVGTCEGTNTNMRTGREVVSLITVREGKLLVSANKGDNSISIFDTDTKSLLQEIPVAAKPNDLWVGPDSNLYVACAGDNVVQIIDLGNPTSPSELRIFSPLSKNRIGLSPVSVTGFSDQKQRHDGVLAVSACTGEPCENPIFMLYYDLKDLELRRFVALQAVDSPEQASLLARHNASEDRIYMMLTNTILSCEFK